MAGGLVLCIDWHNSPHPVGFHVKAEACCHDAWHKNEFAIFGDELDRKGNLLAVGCLFCLQFFERKVAPDGLFICNESCFGVKINGSEGEGKDKKTAVG